MEFPATEERLMMEQAVGHHMEQISMCSLKRTHSAAVGVMNPHKSRPSNKATAMEKGPRWRAGMLPIKASS